MASCNDGDDAAAATLKEAVGSTTQQIDGSRTAADQMLSGVRAVALSDSALDRAAVRADGADARARAQERVIDTNALDGDSPSELIVIDIPAHTSVPIGTFPIGTSFNFLF